VRRGRDQRCSGDGGDAPCHMMARLFATAATFLDLSLRFLWTLSIMPSTINPFELLTQSELAGMCAAAAAPAPGLGSPLPHLRRDWARQRAARSELCGYCAGTLRANNRYQAAILGVLELMRRSMWACFRLEREHLHNRSAPSSAADRSAECSHRIL
jgi:hypothetical protein